MSVQPAILRVQLQERLKMNTATLAHDSEVKAGSVSLSVVTDRTKPAWHSAVNETLDSSTNPTSQDLMESAKLSNWNVRLEPISEIATQHNFVSEAFMVVRDNPFNKGQTDVLATVGSRYKPVQNEELFSFAENLHDSNPDVKADAGGSFKNGRVVFGSWKVPSTLVLDPKGANDVTELFLVVSTSHDGSTALQAGITPVRIRCQNTLNFAMKKAKQSFKIRHTQTVVGKIASAREALGLSVAYFDEFSKQAHELFSREITNAKFEEIINAIYPKPEIDKKGSLTKWENKFVIVEDLYFNSKTNENVKGTAWGALNALTEHLDYFRTARGNGESLAYSASGFDPVISAQKNKIVKQILALTA